MNRRIESIRIPGPAGELEAQLWIPDVAPRGAVLVCHPHPRHGGTMHTKAVHHAARGWAAAGDAVLRFQFRGVGTSTGRYTGGPGERADARAALAFLAARFPGLPLACGGFSFGSWVGCAAGQERAEVRALFALGPPLGLYDFSFVRAGRPLLCAAGTRDIFAPEAALRRFAAAFGPACELVLLDGAEHLLTTHLPALEDAVHRFALRAFDPPALAPGHPVP